MLYGHLIEIKLNVLWQVEINFMALQPSFYSILMMSINQKKERKNTLIPSAEVESACSLTWLLAVKEFYDNFELSRTEKDQTQKMIKCDQIEISSLAYRIYMKLSFVKKCYFPIHPPLHTHAINMGPIESLSTNERTNMGDTGRPSGRMTTMIDIQCQREREYFRCFLETRSRARSNVQKQMLEHHSTGTSSYTSSTSIHEILSRKPQKKIGVYRSVRRGD